MLITANNYGLIVVPPTKTDWIAGEISGITYKVLCTDWNPHLPTEESQIGVYFDTMACVTFSALNICEAIINYYLANKLLTTEQEAFLRDGGYIDENGKVNFSDRFTAKMSGTTRLGNSLTAVWDSIKQHGLLPEKDWAYPRTQRAPVFVWEDYYMEIPQALKDKALKFKEFFDVLYEWVLTGAAKANKKTHDLVAYHSKQAPLQIAAPVCPGWNNVQVASCDLTQPGHATMVFGENVYFDDFDHYNPFKKQLASDYPIPYILKGFVIPKPKAEPFLHLFLEDLVLKTSSDEVKWLQKALFLNGCLYDSEWKNIQDIETWGGYFGENTERAVKAFQKKYGIRTTGMVGPITRKKLNSLFNR